MTQAVTPATACPDSWLSALRAGSGRLAAAVEDLSCQELCLLLGAEPHIYPCEPAEPTGTLSGPRGGGAAPGLRPQPARGGRRHLTGAARLPDLRSLFPGY
ncbi:hypothetical protein ABZ876_23420 [Streptomyces sp. NPDC046931]|uniref:hypothetical protein n=1 Tax=Streptomyces sp. NPDC046931 TaxID=3154806 RepID=UPI0033F1F8F1